MREKEIEKEKTVKKRYALDGRQLRKEKSEKKERKKEKRELLTCIHGR